jgi:hypothetical protein
MLTEKLIKIAARIVRQGRHLTTLIERGITRRMRLIPFCFGTR